MRPGSPGRLTRKGSVSAFDSPRAGESQPEAYLPDVATTLNNLAILYCATQRGKAEECCCEAERLLQPFWNANPQVHGDMMARILQLQAHLCTLLPGRSRKDACAFAQRAFAAANDPDINQATQALIYQFCADAHS
jgi:hypothetical protein